VVGSARERGARFRAAALYRELDVVRELRPQAKAAMVAEARRDPAWPILCSLAVLRAGAGGVAAGHDEDAVAVSDQAESLGL
jgi:hypothetical protein